MGIGERIAKLRTAAGITQETLAEMLAVSRQAVSRWETDQTAPDTEKIIVLSRIFSVSTDRVLLEPEEAKIHQPQPMRLGSIYLIVRDFERSVRFYEALLSMQVSTRNCGNRFAEFFFDNKCLALMNESALKGHHYVEGDGKFVLNFWVEDLHREYERILRLGIGPVSPLRRVHAGYCYFHLLDSDSNTVEITGGFADPDSCEADPLSAAL